ncbi:hypothetical protein BDQ94DRAFT_134090, partial [Aspergillus welwitschiae]
MSNFHSALTASSPVDIIIPALSLTPRFVLYLSVSIAMEEARMVALTKRSVHL